MENLLGMLLGSQNSGAVSQVAKSLNLNSEQVTSGLSSLIPALQSGMKQNVAKGGLESLLGALTKGNNEQYLDQPELLGQQQAVSNGNSILGHLLGGKEQSRQVATQAAQATGMDSSMLKQLLPMAANMLMGGLGKQNQQQSLAKNPSMLESLLDSDGDGSMVDDLMGMAGKLFR